MSDSTCTQIREARGTMEKEITTAVRQAYSRFQEIAPATTVGIIIHKEPPFNRAGSPEWTAHVEVTL